jgi:hypothetical protein
MDEFQIGEDYQNAAILIFLKYVQNKRTERILIKDANPITVHGLQDWDIVLLYVICMHEHLVCNGNSCEAYTEKRVCGPPIGYFHQHFPSK